MANISRLVFALVILAVLRPGKATAQVWTRDVVDPNPMNGADGLTVSALSFDGRPAVVYGKRDAFESPRVVIAKLGPSGWSNQTVITPQGNETFFVGSTPASNPLKERRATRSFSRAVSSFCTHKLCEWNQAPLLVPFRAIIGRALGSDGSLRSRAVVKSALSNSSAMRSLTPRARKKFASCSRNLPRKS